MYQLRPEGKLGRERSCKPPKGLSTDFREGVGPDSSLEMAQSLHPG